MYTEACAQTHATQACARQGGCTLLFPRPQGPAAITAAQTRTATEPYHPYGPSVVAVYRTSAFNLTSHLKLVVEEGVQIRGTEDFRENCGGSNTSTCDDPNSSSWPVLPWAAYPSRPNRGGDSTPAKQAFIRGYNLSDIEISGGGEIHAGGGC